MSYQDLLLRESLQHLAGGDAKTAEKLADRARRSAPFDADLTAFHARLLLLNDRPAETISLLDKPETARKIPEARLDLVTALTRLNSIDRAIETAEDCLRSFAIDAFQDQSALALLCRRAPLHVGWVGISAEGSVTGYIRPDCLASLDAFDETGARLAAATLSSSPPSAGFGFQRFEFRPTASLRRSIRLSCGSHHLLGEDAIRWPPLFGVSGYVEDAGERLEGWVAIDWLPHVPATFLAGDDLGQSARFAGNLVQAGIFRKKTVLELVPEQIGLPGRLVDITILLPDGTTCPLPGVPVELAGCRTIGSRRPPGIPSRDNAAVIQAGTRVAVAITAACGRSIDDMGWIERLPSSFGRCVLAIAGDARQADIAAARRAAALRLIDLLEIPGDASMGELLNALSRHTAPADMLVHMPCQENGQDWIARLRRAAYLVPDTGIVSPLTDPGMAPSRLPDVDAVARQVNAGILTDMVGGLGRCFYIKRACLRDVGGFDPNPALAPEDAIEEFAERARSQGWQSRVAADIVPVLPPALPIDPARGEHGLDYLERRYPGYRDRRDRSREDNPLRSARRRLDEARRLSHAATPSILLLTLAAQGGVARHVREQTETLRGGGFRVVTLKPESSAAPFGHCRLTIQDDGTDLHYRLPREFDDLLRFLRHLNIQHVAIHHFMGLPAELLHLPGLIGVPYDVTIHDYSWICPRVTLIRGRRYCGEPDVRECDICLREHGGLLGEEIGAAQLRERSREILRRADRVIAPSHDAAQRMKRYFPEIDCEERAWEATPLPPIPATPVGEAQRVRVAILGALGIHKGFDLLLQLAGDASARNLPIEFVVIGHTMDDATLAATGRVEITGEYEEAELDQMLTEAGCSVALYASLWPETWCYTLTHAIRAELPILASSLGAFPERLTGYPNTVLFDPATADVVAINRQLEELAKAGRDWHNSAVHPHDDVQSGACLVKEGGESRGTQEYERNAAVSNQTVVRLSDAGRPSIGSTIQILTLGEGLYAFVIQGTPGTPLRNSDVVVPALQISRAPSSAKGELTLLCSPTVVSNWLTKPGDTVVAQVSGGNCQILLTSLSSPGVSPLSLDIRRLDKPGGVSSPGASNGTNPQAERPAPGARPGLPPGAPYAAANQTGSQRRIIRTQVLMHIQNRGDVPFVGSSWAGSLGQRMWVEAFAITPLENIGADALEYKGRTAGGFETPWLSNGAWCGTRGMGVPLIEFAVRIRPQFATAYSCEYSGGFFSGSIVGPSQNGSVCRSTTPNDPLEAIQIRLFAENGPVQGLSGGSMISSPHSMRV